MEQLQEEVLAMFNQLQAQLLQQQQQHQEHQQASQQRASSPEGEALGRSTSRETEETLPSCPGRTFFKTFPRHQIFSPIHG
jgi:hypothetical protein